MCDVDDLSDGNSSSGRRKLPPVHRLLAHPEVSALRGAVPALVLTQCARAAIDGARRSLADRGRSAAPELHELVRETVRLATRESLPSLRPAINATGVVLHTGLGRARLPAAAVEALTGTAASHAVVEIDQETGARGSRQDHVRGLLQSITGADDSLVVNNCAGAVLLAVSCLAAGRDVVVSRGELIEIGGAFRMPDIVTAGGATLVEVGTTNRTRLSDYAAAITDRTGMLLKCHRSNFTMIGFTAEASIEELASLAREHSLPLLVDQGNGAMLPIRGASSTVPGAMRDGASVVAASGDKLLGGPQAGILAGAAPLIRQMARHPLARALRVDKLTLAALEATLRLYLDPAAAQEQVPTLRYLARDKPEIRRMAIMLARQLRIGLDPAQFDIRLLDEQSEVGGGSLTGIDLPTVCVAVSSRSDEPSAREIARRLRTGAQPVFARIHAGRLLLDPRTLERDEIAAAARRTVEACKSGP